MELSSNSSAPAAGEQQSRTPVILQDRAGRTTSIHGVSAILYGLPFIIGGLCAGWVAATFHWSSETNGDLRFSFLVLFAGVLLLGGFFFSAHGALDLVGDARKRRVAAQQPDKPWLGDYAWTPEGSGFSGSRETTKPLATAMVGTAIIAPFVWAALRSPFAWAFDLFVGMLAVLPVAAWWRCLVTLLESLRFGRSFLTYETFPFFVGSMLTARLRVQRNLESVQSLTLTLRCVQEKYVTTGGGRRRNSIGITAVVRYELFKEVLALDHAQIMNWQRGEIPVQFSIPADAPRTHLSSRPPIYWGIEAKGETQGTAYKALFLVPVYEASRVFSVSGSG